MEGMYFVVCASHNRMEMLICSEDEDNDIR